MSALDPVGSERISWSPARRDIAPLVDLDPDLARALPPDRVRAARRETAVRVVGFRRGPLPIERLAGSSADVGVLVVDGMLGRELLAADVASMELLGPGDVLRPWNESGDFELLEAGVRWSALAPTRIAVLDRQLAGRLAHYPEIYGAVLERFAWRTRRLAVLQAICQLNRVDRRLLTLFWHLAERWGRVTTGGVLVPLALSHRMLGQLVGARRPTVSTALATLTEAGELVRADAGTWLLTGAPVGAPDARASRFVAPRRAMLPAAAEAVSS